MGLGTGLASLPMKARGKAGLAQPSWGGLKRRFAIVPSRSRIYAGQGIHVKLIDDLGVELNGEDLKHGQYRFDFGEDYTFRSLPETMRTPRTSRYAWGAYSGHVFETPGVYTVAVWGFDAAGREVEAAPVEIKVDDPATLYDQGRTILVYDSRNGPVDPAHLPALKDPATGGVISKPALANFRADKIYDVAPAGEGLSTHTKSKFRDIYLDDVSKSGPKRMMLRRGDSFDLTEKLLELNPGSGSTVEEGVWIDAFGDTDLPNPILKRVFTWADPDGPARGLIKINGNRAVGTTLRNLQFIDDYDPTDPDMGGTYTGVPSGATYDPAVHVVNWGAVTMAVHVTEDGNPNYAAYLGKPQHITLARLTGRGLNKLFVIDSVHTAILADCHCTDWFSYSGYAGTMVDSAIVGGSFAQNPNAALGSGQSTANEPPSSTSGWPNGNYANQGPWRIASPDRVGVNRCHFESYTGWSTGDAGNFIPQPCLRFAASGKAAGVGSISECHFSGSGIPITVSSANHQYIDAIPLGVVCEMIYAETPDLALTRRPNFVLRNSFWLVPPDGSGDIRVVGGGDDNNRVIGDIGVLARDLVEVYNNTVAIPKSRVAGLALWRESWFDHAPRIPDDVDPGTYTWDGGVVKSYTRDNSPSDWIDWNKNGKGQAEPTPPIYNPDFVILKADYQRGFAENNLVAIYDPSGQYSPRPADFTSMTLDVIGATPIPAEQIVTSGLSSLYQPQAGSPVLGAATAGRRAWVDFRGQVRPAAAALGALEETTDLSSWGPLL